MLPIGFYRPDLAESNSGLSLTIRNAILFRDEAGVAYGPHPSLEVLSSATALPGPPRGALSVVARDGSYQNYAGTEDKLYKVAADGSWTEIGSGYAVPGGDNWSMAQFGDYVYFTNRTDGLMRYSIESGGTVDAVAGAPAARVIFLLFNTLAALDCDGNNRLMKTSKINDPTVWSGDASCTYQEFPEGEELIGGGELGQTLAVVLQRNAVRVLARTTDRSIFTTSLLSSGVGAQGTEGVTRFKGWCYFMDTDGPQRTNGSVIEPIGRNKIAKTMTAALPARGADTVQTTSDPATNRILYRYRSLTVTDENVFQDILAYDIDTGEWVPISMATSWLIAMASPGYTLEELDAFGTLDTLPYSLDDRYWKGGEPQLTGFNGAYKFGFMSGTPLAATLETGTRMEGGAVRITGAVPLTDAPAPTVQLGVKRALRDTLAWGAAVNVDADGFAPVDEAGQWYSLRFSVPAGQEWSFMRGFEAIEMHRQGRR